MDPLLLAAHGILLGSIRMSTLAAAIFILVPSAFKFLLFMFFLRRRHLLVNYFLRFVSFVETVVHGLGVATVFFLTVSWYHVAHIVLLALLVLFLVALVWYSDWCLALEIIRNRAMQAVSRVSKSDADVEVPGLVNAMYTTFDTALDHLTLQFAIDVNTTDISGEQ